MRKYFISLIIVIIFIQSCSSVKESLSPLNTYLSSKLNDNDTIIVIENKINNNFAIDFLKRSSVVRVDNNTIEGSTGLKFPLYKEEYWDIMNRRYRNKITDKVWLKTELWNRKDFRNTKIKFIREDAFPKPYVYNEYMTAKKRELSVFSFSEPIFYKNSKYVIFAKSETSTKKQFIEPNSIIIMKKEKGKWIVVKVIGDYVYY